MSGYPVPRDFSGNGAAVLAAAPAIVPPPAPPPSIFPPIPSSTFRQAGTEGWIGRLMVEKEIVDLVVLRPPGVADRDALASARQKLAQVTGDAAAIRKIAVGAILYARSRSDSSTVNVAQWRIVEARVDQDGRAWVGLYESGHGHNDTWMVELDEVNHPSAVWRRQKRESRNLSDCGEKLR